MKKTSSEPQPSVDGGFIRALQEHQQGAVINELSEALRTITKAAGAVGKPAQLTLKVTVLPQGNAVGFAAVVDTKLPKGKPFVGVFFADDDGNVSRHDKSQPEIPALKTVEAPAAGEQELRKAVNA